LDCHSVEELRFQLLDRRDMTLLQGGVAWDSEFLCTFYRVASDSFPPLSGESGILALFGWARALLLSRTVGSAESPCSVRRESSWHQKMDKPGVSLRCATDTE
jgi:hypothetical protein